MKNWPLKASTEYKQSAFFTVIEILLRKFDACREIAQFGHGDQYDVDMVAEASDIILLYLRKHQLK